MNKTVLTMGVAAFAAGWTGMAAAEPAAPAPEEVKAITKKVADWQIRTFEDQVRYRAVSSSKRERIEKAKKDPNFNLDKYDLGFTKKWHDREWHNAALYAGMNEWRKVADDPKPYTDWLRSIGERNGWVPHWRKYNADDHAVGHFYLGLYEEFREPEMIAPMRKRFDEILANPKTGSLEMKKGTDANSRWGWCDALFMAPPVWARMAKLTGEQKYLDFMDQEYHATYDLLWSKEHHLFFRDSRYFTKHEANGRNVFWSRGNGWVFSGLALMIPDLPRDWEGRQFYIDTFRQMAETLRKTQRPDGTWSMGLLGDPKDYPIPETSGTSFFTHGLAWGINNGLLDRAAYEPVVLKAWAALTACVTEEGLLGHVQPVGAAPGESYPDKTEVYGVGAFLSAGSEVYKMVKENDRSAQWTTFMKDTGWCWYEDPRSIIHDGKLIIGGVSGTSGDVRVGVYDLKADRPLGVATLHEKFQPDDHDSPAFHVRSDGSLLAVYARHNNNPYHCSRISEPGNPLKWGKEMKHVRASKNPKDKVTYMNLYTLKDQGVLCNFYRGLEFNPTLVTSADEGLTWSDPVHLITHDIGSRQRPYARYAQIDENTVGISFTDAHPRQYGNSLYYAEFRDGAFYNVDGTKIKELADGPLVTVNAEKIYKGSEINEWKGHKHSVSNSAWTVTIASDAAGHPHIGYSVYHTHQDHHYRIASWDGKRWHDRQIAFGGSCLYDEESSYTGLFAIDPEDPSKVYISTDVDPKTGKPTGGVHEIYAAEIGLDDDVTSIEWKQLTFNSEYKNIRPIVVAGEGYKVLLWLGGHPWHHYQSYETDALGMILERP